MYSLSSSLTFCSSASNLLTTFLLKYASAFLCLWLVLFFEVLLFKCLHPSTVYSLVIVIIFLKIGKCVGSLALDFKIYNVSYDLIWQSVMTPFLSFGIFFISHLRIRGKGSLIHLFILLLARCFLISNFSEDGVKNHTVHDAGSPA